MAQETEELKLRITIDDQASAQLQRVHQQLSQIGSGPTSQGLHQITTKTTRRKESGSASSREFLGVGGRGAMGLRLRYSDRCRLRLACLYSKPCAISRR